MHKSLSSELASAIGNASNDGGHGIHFPSDCTVGCMVLRGVCAQHRVHRGRFISLLLMFIKGK